MHRIEFWIVGEGTQATASWHRKVSILRRAAPGRAQVVAVPFSTGFNHNRIADEVNYKFVRCMAALAARPATAALPQLPVYGVGHSLGALIQVGSEFSSPAPRSARAGLHAPRCSASK